MLAELDRIPWVTLQHAYGNADDIPAMIRALASKDEKQKEWAQQALETSSFHQGQIYSSTPLVARFLGELSQENELPAKKWIIAYLKRLLIRAEAILSEAESFPDDDVYELWAKMTRKEWRQSNRNLAKQILDEIHPYREIVLCG
ncbi:MAG: hypothetical protein L6Q98_24855 [Anaerolineae bacterium]|nr:hypothetical protein [Anaerolineae bacterium]NUQ07083.1 hypothetical protein [Anaerolineae bacterium]